MRTTTERQALSGAHLNPDRELCKQGCREWVPWYRGRKGKTVYGCRIGRIPEKRDPQWYCRRFKPGNSKEGVGDQTDSGQAALVV